MVLFFSTENLGTKGGVKSENRMEELARGVIVVYRNGGKRGKEPSCVTSNEVEGQKKTSGNGTPSEKMGGSRRFAFCR